MALTRDFKQTIKARAAADVGFRLALLREGIESVVAGDLDTSTTILRDYLNVTAGREAGSAREGLGD